MTYREYAGSSRCSKIYPKRSTKKVFTLKMSRKDAKALAANLNRAYKAGWNTVEVHAHRRKTTDGDYPVTVCGPLTTI